MMTNLSDWKSTSQIFISMLTVLGFLIRKPSSLNPSKSPLLIDRFCNMCLMTTGRRKVKKWRNPRSGLALKSFASFLKFLSIWTWRAWMQGKEKTSMGKILFSICLMNTCYFLKIFSILFQGCIKSILFRWTLCKDAWGILKSLLSQISSVGFRASKQTFHSKVLAPLSIACKKNVINIVHGICSNYSLVEEVDPKIGTTSSLKKRNSFEKRKSKKLRVMSSKRNMRILNLQSNLAIKRKIEHIAIINILCLNLLTLLIWKKSRI